MAIDSAAKRASVQSYTLGLLRPPPDIGVSAEDRAQIAWFYRGLTYGPPVEPTEEFRMETAFIETVPEGAVYRGGRAFAQDGAMYVAALTEDAVFIAGIAHTQDGAMCINPAGSPAFYLGGWGMTGDGEVCVSTDEPLFHHGGVGLLENGTVCMTEVEA